MAKSLLGLSHCFMLLACRFIPENSPLTHRYPMLVYARILLTTLSRVNRCSSFSPHSFAVLRLMWLEQTALYSLFLELQIGMQTVREVPNTQKQRAVIRSAYSHRVQWRIRHHGQFEAPKNVFTDTGKIKFHCTLLGKGYCIEMQTMNAYNCTHLRSCGCLIFKLECKVYTPLIYLLD